ncbi:hypothetical protein Tco_0977304 [Tanacetum coccineum]|uniref:Uncharacterized protein n=1 Tax=Tanacetum coccineum TaxID=301880 RepID=A0ABQ5EKU3_9ASTR
MEYLVKINKKELILELKQRHLKITVLTSNMPYPSRKIRRICACTSPKTTKYQGSIRRLSEEVYRLRSPSEGYAANRDKMDNPNITMEEYIRLEEKEKARQRGKVYNWETAKYGKIAIRHMVPLPPPIRDLVCFDIMGLTPEMRQDLAKRLRMVYTGDDGQEIFVSHAWRRLFEIRAPLVCDFILEFLNTYRISSEMGLDAADALCFQLGGARRSITWRQFILALGFHTVEEMAEDGFKSYWLESERVIPDKGDLSDYWIEISSNRDFLRVAPSYTYIRDLQRRLCHRHAKGRKSGARLSGGHFIGCLAHHFGLVNDDGLRGLSVVTHELPLIDMGELVKLNIWSAEDAPDVDEGTQAVPAPVHAPPPPPAAGRTMP